MTHNIVYSNLCTAIILVLSSGAALSGEAQIRYHDKASGSFASSVVDTNQDGIPGITTDMHGRSSAGPVTISSFSEFDPTAATPSVNCTAPKIEFPVVHSTSIHRFTGGELMYLITTQEIFCADLSTGEFEWTETLEVTGGTGRYSGASGTVEVSGSGNVLSADPSGVLNFGGLSLTSQGTISLQRGNH